jgi:hypothetical protein
MISYDSSVTASYLQICLTLDYMHGQVTIRPDQQPALLIESRACNDNLPRLRPDVPFREVIPYGESDRDEDDHATHDRDRCYQVQPRGYDNQLTIDNHLEW